MSVCLPSDKRCPQMMDSADIPGLAITLIQDSIIWEQGFGFKNGETQTIVHTNTIFEAASLSKPVFAYIVMKLVEKGKLNLDIPLTHYVPREHLAKALSRGWDDRPEAYPHYRTDGPYP